MVNSRLKARKNSELSLSLDCRGRGGGALRRASRLRRAGYRRQRRRRRRWLHRLGRVGKQDIAVGLAEAPDALDPTTAATFVGRTVFANMCQKLYDINAGLQIVPQLAASLPVVSDGARTYTINLKPGILFSSRTPFNAAAVKTTLTGTSLTRNPSAPASSKA